MMEDFEEYFLGSKARQLSEEEIHNSLTPIFITLSKKSPNSLELAECHSLISDLMKQSNFLNALITLIISFQTNPEHNLISTLAVTTLSTFLRQQQSRGNGIPKHNKHLLNKKLVETYIRDDLFDKYRIMMLKQYQVFIYAPGMETIRSQTIDSMINTSRLATVNIQRSVQEPNFFLSSEYGVLKAQIPLAQMFLHGPLEIIYIKNIWRCFYEPVILMAKLSSKLLQQAVLGKNEPAFIAISYIIQNLLNFLKDLVLMTSRDGLYVTKQQIIKDGRIAEIVATILSLSLNPKQPGVIVSEIIINSNGSKYIDRINDMKKNCLQIVKYFADILAKVKTFDRQVEKEYLMPLHLVGFFINYIPNTLLKEFESLSYPINDLPSKEIYKIIMKTFSKVVRIHKFYNQCAAYRSMLIFRLCLPLLQRKETEEITSAADYKSVRQDILNMHSIDIPENSVCSLLESYVDKIDGSLLFITTNLLHMIEFQLTANVNIIEKISPQLIESPFFKNVNYLVQIECGLTAVALLSYMAPGREDIVQIIEQMFIARQSFLFRSTNPGTLKCAVLLCYTYYIDNFYNQLISKKSQNHSFHLRVFDYCCEYMSMYTGLSPSHGLSKQEIISLEIGALQAIDCINNCVTQAKFLEALFWEDSNWSETDKEDKFLNIFNFLLNQLNYSMNIAVIECLVEFYTQAIKNQCQYGFAIKRYQYEYKDVPIIIRQNLSNAIARQIYHVYNNENLANKDLMKNKIMHLLEIVMTCCEEPDNFMSADFFTLKIDVENYWDVISFVDIYVRRMIVFKRQGREINSMILNNIFLSCMNIFSEIKEQYKFKSVFGILINLIVLNQTIVDRMAQPIGKLLVELLQEEESEPNYNDQLENLIEKTAYVVIIAISARFSPTTQPIWCQLVAYLQEFLIRRSTRGIIATRSSPYIGKLLTICLVCLFNMLGTNYLQENDKAKQLWTNILRNSDIFTSMTEKMITATILMKLLLNRTKIEENDEECKQCFKFISLLLYFAFSSSLKRNMMQDEEGALDSSSSGVDDDDSDEKEQSVNINYRQYGIDRNQYLRSQPKEKPILDFKSLCHQLKENSPEFLKNSVDILSIPIQNFVKQKVYYFEGSISDQGMRKLLKVKK